MLTNNVNKVLKLMSSEKACFVIDMEKLDDETQAIFNNCNNKIVIGSLSPWCQSDYYRFMDRINKYILNDIDAVTFLYIGNRKKTINDKLYGCKMSRLPIIEDPFSLKESEFEPLTNLVK